MLFRSDVEELEQVIKKTTKELDELQKNCSHPKESVKIKDINPESSSDIRKICGICNHILGYPSKEEMDKWTGASNIKPKSED